MNGRVQTAMCRVLGIALLVGGVAAVDVRAQATPDAEFKKIAEAFSDAWAKGDAKAIAALHTKDAVRMAGDGQPAAVGTAAIEKGFTTTLTGPYKDTRLVITPGKTYRVTADTYVGEGTYEVTGGTPPAGAPTRGQYLNTLVRQDGRWFIAASAVMPATTAK